MKKKVWIWVAVITGILVIASTGTYFYAKAGTEPVSNDSGVMSVSVQKVSEQELVESILVTGKIVPESEQKVFLEPEKGEISEFKVAENQAVKAGDPLLIYDSSKIDSELNRAVREKELLQSRGKTEQSQISDLTKRLAEAKKKMETQGPSAEGQTEGIPTQEDVNQLANEKVQQEMQYESTKSEITSAEDRIKELNAQKNEMTIVSKMDGIIVKVNQNVANTEAGAAEPVIHIISSQPYKVIGSMSEFDTVKIKEGQPVIIRPKVFKDREWNGAVESVSQFPNADGGGGEGFEGGGGAGNVTMYPFKVVITDDTSELRQGFHVSLEIKAGDSTKKIAIPHPALMDEAGIKIVYVLKDGTLERREVQTGVMNDAFIEVTSGVTPGELVVLTPTGEMHDGMEVTSYDEVE
ncbi:multidrug efflux pump subunit AcrA (membrane-fusion protein) [Bacillus niacini]|uniref:Multidrug efflux pump subunit AcrA (Membrane-fusion protein) n=1 Tax=Neobacillus niacini TaxID=86668 RepID=A0A852THC6_9BACI|nr:HlyD family efflux transporter periplasmic adaptor subunit [Neobacillus niacini]NYE08360.1 multidrug efflux pump subunit AcrA (membrane-fusion protein) [Neobacillus niacini]